MLRFQYRFLYHHHITTMVTTIAPNFTVIKISDRKFQFLTSFKRQNNLYVAIQLHCIQAKLLSCVSRQIVDSCCELVEIYDIVCISSIILKIQDEVLKDTSSPPLILKLTLFLSRPFWQTKPFEVKTSKLLMLNYIFRSCHNDKK